MDAAGESPPEVAVASPVDESSAVSGSTTTTIFGLSTSAAAAAGAAALVLVVVLVAAATARICARRRRGAKHLSMSSRVEHAPSSSRSGSLRPTPKEKDHHLPSSYYVDGEIGGTGTTGTGTSSSDVASSSGAAASYLESPATRKIPERISCAAAMDMGWGRWYDLEELEAATGGFRAENVVGEGGYGTVYRGVLAGGEVVAVKNLLDHKGQAEKEFKVEVEAIGKVRHKHLVGLVGYCAEGPKRMLVYEFVENGNLEQWLHGDVGPVSPLTWDIRMKIAVGTAKGIAYLHEGLEPKVVHRDIKSSNILLDTKWNPKVSDFGMAKVLGSGSSYVNTRVMGTFGYVAPEYASTGMLNESSDIYSFGVLLMELISGKRPVDYSKSAGEVNLVEWFKGMVGSRRVEELVDPRIEDPPPARALNRVLLVCLRCIDSDAHKRPKMGQIVHMLEGDEFPFRTEHRSPRATHRTSPNNTRPLLMSEKVGADDLERSMWR
uniref:non-specific serine/threonine protein kinase n=1 Tax=Leersia perrieri TaxID=77586 RepID=A0A0D9VRI2_9ORYZ